MQSLGHISRRLVCCIKGHRPFPLHDVPDTPPDIKTYTIGNIIAGPGLGLASNGSWSKGIADSSYSPGVSFVAGPVASTARICSRCHGVYWNSTIKGSYFMNAGVMPELEPYMKWQERQIWEAKQRNSNELADKLYRQYQVALKIVFDPGDDNAEA